MPYVDVPSVTLSDGRIQQGYRDYVPTTPPGDAGAANEISVEETRRRCGSSETFDFLLSHGLFGTLYRRGDRKTTIWNALNPLAPRPAKEFFARDHVERAFAQLREMVAGLKR